MDNNVSMKATKTKQSEKLRARRLTHKQEIFTTKYIENNGNGTKSAIQAGYSPKVAPVTASRNIRNDNVQQSIKRKLQAIGFNDDFISSKLKDITEAGTSTSSLRKTSVRDALSALRTGAELYGLLGNKHIDNKTLVIKADLSKQSAHELKEELIRLRNEEEKYLND